MITYLIDKSIGKAPILEIWGDISFSLLIPDPFCGSNKSEIMFKMTVNVIDTLAFKTLILQL